MPGTAMKTLWILSFVFLNLQLIAQNKNQDLKILLDTDKAFSVMSAEKGKEAAFVAYATEDAILLRIKSDPIEGRNQIGEYIKTILSVEKPDGILTWVPQNVSIAASGELGYTYGLYKIESKSTDGKVQLQHGSYVTIWKKQLDGTWKFVLDSSNPGLTDQK